MITAPRRVLPYVSVPTSAEKAVRRRFRARYELNQISVPSTHRVRATRRGRQRRILARSRSATATSSRECSRRHAYERSHSCPEYPVFTNTYKITENNKDYIFQLPMKEPTISQRIDLFQHIKERRTLPQNIYYGPMLVQAKIMTYPYKKKHSQSSHTFISHSLDQDFYHNSNQSREVKRRRLPNIGNLSLDNPRVKCLPDFPNLHYENVVDSKVDSQNVSQTNDEERCQYHGYDSEGSDAETTIHISIDKQTSLDREYDTRNFNNDTTNSNDIHNVKNKRKKFLSLDLKTNYDNMTSNQDVDFIDNKENDRGTTITSIDPLKPKKMNSFIRRHSDSLVVLNSNKSSPLKIQDIFKMMSLSSSKKHFDDNVNIDHPKKHNNVVSIDEIPTFQEYSSPKPLSPQCVIDNSCKKPLPSIIKTARSRSYSVATTDHVRQEFSMIANSICIALSPSNLGSNRRALTPVAPHLPLDDMHRNTSNATETPTLGEHHAASDLLDHQRFQHILSTGKSATKKREKRSNDYGGTENGRNNNHAQQPLERRESRRGQFTRSLSNADVPPDEKAGTFVHNNPKCIVI